MEPTLIYGHPLGSSMGLIAAFEWLGQPYRLTRVAMPDDIKTEEFAHINGRQETPVLLTPEGQFISESMAIALWLEDRDIGRRISFAPGSAEANRMHQAMAFLNSGFTGAFSPYWVAFEAEGADPAFRQALRDYGKDAVNERHAKFEAMLGDTPYIVGDRPTLADALFIGIARWADFHEAIDPAQFPRIAALRARLEADPAVRFAIAVENGEHPDSAAMQGEVPLSRILERVKEPA